MFTWTEATQWRHLPAAGGLQDQDEMLMDNIFLIASAINRVRNKR